ncbi:uncharacterized protein LOC110722061 [Chenopodium quinoa]|uniref:uncharacterized protein LOC110722061 n=1 Tax=Chenopodium quinoa TaxID=63459 RepID=UPI000B793A1E|nr:uncharacterized protein LOC110722061 [Chenopodium quinoa]
MCSCVTMFMESKETKMAIVVDDSIKKPAIPFNWEIRPGVSKFQPHQSPEPPSLLLSSSSSRLVSSSSSPSQELQTGSVQSVSLSSNSKKFPSSSLTRLELVSSQNRCLPIKSWLRWRWEKKTKVAKPKLKLKLELDPECVKDYAFYLEKLARWSTMPSSRRLSSSSFSSRLQRSSSQSTSRDVDEVAPSRLFRNLVGFLRRQKMIGMEGNGRENKDVNISIYVVKS